jgi:molybdenum ABC transporter, periplasmic molybdate-binding protein
MKEIASAYEKESGDKILFNFGASSLLARQIIERAPADIFISADEAKMDELAKAGLIATEHAVICFEFARDRCAIRQQTR